MNQNKLEAARDAALEFLRRTNALQKQVSKEGWSITGSPLTAAVRRQSMELTRALAHLRRPN